MKIWLFSFIIFLPIFLHADEEEVSRLFHDLQIVKKVDQEVADQLPFQYNYTLMGGYFTMPSARMNESGMVALSFAYVPPYRIYGANIQALSRLEFSINYRIYAGVPDQIMGKDGFGDFSDRGANIKLGILRPEDGFPYFPEIAIGLEDFYGTKRFHSFYGVATKSFLDFNLEATVGWGKGRIRGWFGGIGWTPFRKTRYPILNHLTLLGEWDAIDYKKHIEEHSKGRRVKSRLNLGISATFWDTLELKVGSLRGEKIAGSASLRYNLGTSKGFFPKVDNPSPYNAPVNVEPLGLLREEKELAQELAFAFSEQGLNLYQVYLIIDEENKKALWMKIINGRYRVEKDVKERVDSLLSSLLPSNIHSVIIVVEADGIPTHEYRFRSEDLVKLREGMMEDFFFQTLSSMKEPSSPPTPYEGTLLYHRSKRIWTFTIRPRLLTFFGSATGKFKYSIGIVTGPEGYLFDQFYYKLQGSYQIKSSISDVGDMDKINPSQLLNVRSDSIRYYQTNSFSLEQAYIQKGFYWRRGIYTRLSCGYFEPAYGGIAAECLYYPVRQNWAIGIEAAWVLKRRYHGLGFTTKIRKLKGFTPEYVHFIGYQYFLDCFYHIEPLQVDCKISLGKFLARDLGARFEVSRYFSSGMRFSVWYTLTNAHDIVNRSRYREKGIAFVIPLDLFLKKSSRSMIGYALSVWLRDTGARSATGKPLYPTLRDEREF